MDKLRIGIFFGGNSREREVSFAGGRTVYDNLNKSLFEPVPIFVDSFNRFILLNWKYIYKGSIRDFYPPAVALPGSPNGYQIYAESLGNELSNSDKELLTQDLGQTLTIEALRDKIDFAFLCLHGTNGEDGRLQGLLEWQNIPYSGSGILPSALGIDKAIQRKWMEKGGFATPAYHALDYRAWKTLRQKPSNLAQLIKQKVGFPCVVKSATQGSSIGISVLTHEAEQALVDAVDKAFFQRIVTLSHWQSMSAAQQAEWVRNVADIREGLGMPLFADEQKIAHPEALLSFLYTRFASQTHSIMLRAADAEHTVLFEAFIEGKEFSSIVIDKGNNTPVCLPPTEIRKGKEIFDYRAKYLPGLSRKITPIDLPTDAIQQIREQCEALYRYFGFGVYARIDGFYGNDGKIYLNDPNTTSGMMPSSFFFHQAAEIGFNPSQFITYIISTSLKVRAGEMKFNGKSEQLLAQLQQLMQKASSEQISKKRIAVIFGGYSSERHISVESGRNVYEKLSSSDRYEPIPIFLTGHEKEHRLFQLPINLLLKDNADDIKEKIRHFEQHPIIESILETCTELRAAYGSKNSLMSPLEISYDQLAEKVDEVFIALHGRPGEDGVVQQELEKRRLPYNGSGPNSAAITIDKFETNERLKQAGLLVANHTIIRKDEWALPNFDWKKRLAQFTFPIIAKPVDDGCSSAVKKINDLQSLQAFATLLFRDNDTWPEAAANFLRIKPKEEFPAKDRFLVESLITKAEADHFLEITGGMLTHLNPDGSIRYEIFEASEALSEGDVLSLEEKFLAGQGQNITPARYDQDPEIRQRLSDQVRETFEKAARVLNIEGYCRIDAFVRVYERKRVEVIFIEVNSLPGMTPATCIFHQTAINGYKPYDFIEKIMTFAERRYQYQALAKA